MTVWEATRIVDVKPLQSKMMGSDTAPVPAVAQYPTIVQSFLNNGTGI